MPKDTILLVDDDVFCSDMLMEELWAVGLKAITVRTYTDAKKVVASKHSKIAVAILDVLLPIGKCKNINEKEKRFLLEGVRSGKVFAEWLKCNYPDIFFAAYSNTTEKAVIDWFVQEKNSHFFSKISDRRSDVVRYICEVIGIKMPGPKCFIVHGHDKESIYELKNYLQNTRKFPEPVILKEQAGGGLTLIEKFEESAENVELVFILLTPDDVARHGEDGNETTHRARQNVIFEMGYFLGKFGRKRGRVILLCKGNLELPSDISGWLSIDISNGINSAAVEIEKEIKRLFPKTSL